MNPAKKARLMMLMEYFERRVSVLQAKMFVMAKKMPKEVKRSSISSCPRLRIRVEAYELFAIQKKTRRMK